jgi:hypothetical protein
MLAIVGMLFYLVGFVCAIMILIHAFSKGGVVQGLLCLFIPFYILYYMFAKFEHPKKTMIIAGFFGGYILGAALVVMGAGMSMGR